MGKHCNKVCFLVDFMKRIAGDRIRYNWQKKVQNVGFYFYEIDGFPYWDESVHYEFETHKIDHVESVTEELYEMLVLVF
jgi:glutathionylspermidine synthase